MGYPTEYIAVNFKGPYGFPRMNLLETRKYS